MYIYVNEKAIAPSTAYGKKKEKMREQHTDTQ